MEGYLYSVFGFVESVVEFGFFEQVDVSRAIYSVGLGVKKDVR